jgi:hypothetical protein
LVKAEVPGCHKKGSFSKIGRPCFNRPRWPRAEQTVVKLGDFSSLLQITFSINAVAAYLNSTRQDALDQMRRQYDEILVEYPEAAQHKSIKDVKSNNLDRYASNMKAVSIT